MTPKDHLEEFDESKYAEEAKQRWGKTREYAESQRKWASYSKEQKEAIRSEGDRLITRMVSEDTNAAPDDPDVQAAIGDFHVYINNYFYSCNVVALRGLADMWVEDPRFANKFEENRAGGAEFVHQAVQVFCDNGEQRRLK